MRSVAILSLVAALAGLGAAASMVPSTPWMAMTTAAQVGPPEPEDASSREFTVRNEPAVETPFLDAVSREFTARNEPAKGQFADDAVAREFTVRNEPAATDPFADAVGREFTIRNEPDTTDPFADAVSREWTIRNEQGAVGPYLDAVSREFSIRNEQGALDGYVDAISREFSIRNEQGALDAFVDAVSREFTLENTCRACPDLQVTAIDAPANGVEGQDVSIRWTVRNIGASDAQGDWVDRVYLSDDAAVGDDTFLDDFPMEGPLPASAEYTNTATVTLPAGAVGPHYLIVVADALDTVVEPGGEDNNALVDDGPIDIQPAPQPDLAASGVMAPTAALADETIEVQWTVTNTGNADALPAWLDTVFISANGETIPLGSRPRITPLPADGQYTAALPVIVPGRVEGTFEVCVTADSLDDVNESGDPANNTACAPAPITISQPPRPNLVAAEIDTPPSGLLGQNLNLRFVVTNEGQAPATGIWFDSVVAVNTATSEEIVLAQSIAHTGPVEVNGTYEATQITPPATYPLAAGEYRLKVILDRTDAVNEGLTGGEENNVALDDGTFIVGSYVVSVTAGLDAAVAGTPVPLSGRATLPGTDDPVANAAVAIGVRVRDSVRVIAKTIAGQPILTDANGRYGTRIPPDVVFQPLPTEAGHYFLTAGPPENIDPAVQDEFILYGMRCDPQPAAVVVQPGGAAVSGQVTLRNLGDAPLSGLQVAVDDMPAGLDVLVDLNVNELGPLESADIGYLITASPEALGSASIVFRFSSEQGAVAETRVQVTVRPPRGHLVLAGPSPVTSPMLRNLPPPQPGEPEIVNQTHVEFRIANDGSAATGPLTVVLPPNTPWMIVATPEVMPPLAPDGVATVGLILSPTSDQALGPYEGQIVIAGEDVGLAVPFRFIAVSSAMGDMRVIAEDESTYWGEGRPPLSGATVALRDAINNGVVGEAQTNAAGEAFFAGLTEAYYDVEVRAPEHGTYRGLVLVIGGQATEVRAFLPIQTVTYSWNVEQTEIEDQYIITLDVVFETNVPAPVIRVVPAFVDLAALTSEYTQIDFEVFNDGLITADQVSIGFFGNDRFGIDALVADLGDMPAHARYTVPVIIHDRQFGGRGSGSSCGANGAVNYSLVCGTRRHYSTGIFFNDPQQCGGGGPGGPGDPGDPGGPCCNGSGGPGDPYVNNPSISTPQPCCEDETMQNCCDPPCADCEECQYGMCIPQCSPTECCVNGECFDAGCEASACEICAQGENGVTCVSRCRRENCEGCVSGECQVTCGECQICDGLLGQCLSCSAVCLDCEIVGDRFECTEPLCTVCQACNLETGTCDPILEGEWCAECHKCRNGVCQPTPNAVCGECGICDAANNCVNDPQGPPCPACQTCINAQCVPLQFGTPCGESGCGYCDSTVNDGTCFSCNEPPTPGLCCDQGVCVPAGTVLSDGSCCNSSGHQSSAWCTASNGRCVWFGELCDPATCAVCGPGGQCISQERCGAQCCDIGEICVENECVRCSDTGRGDGDKDSCCDPRCGDCEVCIGKQCRPICPPGYCCGIDGQCIPPGARCGANTCQICLDGVCVGEPSSCGPPDCCTESGACVGSGGPCGEGECCVNGSCVACSTPNCCGPDGCVAGGDICDHLNCSICLGSQGCSDGCPVPPEDPCTTCDSSTGECDYCIDANDCCTAMGCLECNPNECCTENGCMALDCGPCRECRNGVCQDVQNGALCSEFDCCICVNGIPQTCASPPYCCGPETVWRCVEGGSLCNGFERCGLCDSSTGECDNDYCDSHACCIVVCGYCDPATHRCVSNCQSSGPCQENCAYFEGGDEGEEFFACTCGSADPCARCIGGICDLCDQACEQCVFGECQCVNDLCCANGEFCDGGTCRPKP